MSCLLPVAGSVWIVLRDEDISWFVTMAKSTCSIYAQVTVYVYNKSKEVLKYLL